MHGRAGEPEGPQHRGDAMGDERTTVLCRWCRERIDASARRCPHCRAPQSKWAISSHPAVGAAFMLVALIILGAMFFHLTGHFSDGRDFTDYLDKLQIVESEVVSEEKDGWTTTAVVGRIRNNSDVAWKDVQIEVQFRDGDGKLVDTFTDSDLAKRYPPGEVRAFKASGWAYLPAERYASYEASVVWAKEAKVWW